MPMLASQDILMLARALLESSCDSLMRSLKLYDNVSARLKTGCTKSIKLSVQ